MPGTLSELLLPLAANNRHGLVFAPQTATISKSDVEQVWHVGVPFAAENPWKSASGGVATNERDAQLAAIGEGVERYSAAIIQLPLRARDTIPKSQRLDAEHCAFFSEAQQCLLDFPFANLYSQNCQYTNIYELGNNHEFWAPHPLVALRDDYETGIPTSSGLAAGQTTTQALLRATQELIERDALMATWLHSLPGRSLTVPAEYATAVKKLGGTINVFDLTPAYSPFPVIAVAGGIPKRGKWRYSLGVACRETLNHAIEKAYLEWCQGVFFAGIYPKYVDTEKLTKPEQVNSFDEHAIYYTQNPEHWHKLPLLAQRDQIMAPLAQGVQATPTVSLTKAVKRLKKAGFRLFYRDLTTIDALQAGVRVVRVLSPDMIPINAHHEWPFLGGNSARLELRYPDAHPIMNFPNPFPHPLG